MGLPDPLSTFAAVTAAFGVLGLSFFIRPDSLFVVDVEQAVEVLVEVPTGEGPVDAVAPSAPPAPRQKQAAPAVPEMAVTALPLKIRIGTISVDAPIVPVGLEENGAMEVPGRVAEIGWYDPAGLGVRPGASGTAVFAGHVDSRSQGRGALYDLRDLRVGEIIEVDLDDGSMQRWLVTEVSQAQKGVLPLASVFTWVGSPRLAVITCGGEFDRTVRSYTDNLVVYAEPLELPPSTVLSGSGYGRT